MFLRILLINGIPKHLIDTSLHQIEIRLKKSSGGFPMVATFNELNAVYTSQCGSD